jgi:uncharacterized protein
MFFPVLDPSFILLIPAMVLALWAQAKVRSTYRKFSEVASASGLTGAQVAQRILSMEGLSEVEIEPIPGELTDHYDPRSKKVRLSEGIYGQRSVAALGIAAHEVGHAIQHSHSFVPLSLRSAFLMPANIGSTLAMPLFFVGFIFSSVKVLMDIGIYLFIGVLAFQLVTLPVEFDASRRALKSLGGSGLMASAEVDMARKVLTAAAWTYVAAAAVSVSHLLRLLILRNARD